LIQSSWYQSLWGNRFHFTGDQNAKIKFENNHAGFKLATSVGGVGTGERGDRFIVDDPHNVKDGESDPRREASLLWFRESVTTRVNDPKKSAIVVIMQRVHEKDVSGDIIADELGYEHLMLPMEFEPERKCYTSIGFEDPRKKDGELLCPERMPEEVVERDKKALGSYASAAQFQQSPTPRGGGMFKKDWFEIVEVPPAIKISVRGWDLAASETTRAAWTVGVKLSRGADGVFYVEDVVRFKGSPGKVEKKLKNIASQDGFDVTIDLPQDPGQAGKAQIKYLVSMLAGYTVRFSPESGDKETRASPLASQAEAGNVKLVRGLWNEDFLEELSKFPFSEFKDQTDAASRAFARLVDKSAPIVAAAPQVVHVNG
jgi:predicted phage terminase large subunit-like protein